MSQWAWDFVWRQKYVACSRPEVSAVSAIACVEIKVQVVLQFEVCHGRSEVLLSGYGRVYSRRSCPSLGRSEGRGAEIART